MSQVRFNLSISLDGFVALFLPELNIKVTVGEFALNEPGLPFWSVVHRVFLSLHAVR